MDTKEQILTNELRNDLKEVFQKELRQLPKQLLAQLYILMFHFALKVPYLLTL